MAKITLDTITSSFASTSLFNTNFAAIKSELDDKVLYRDNPTGEANQMLNDLDMNSNDILNASSVNADVIVLNGTQITPTGTTSLPASGLTYDNSTSGLTATNVQDAIDEVDSDLDTAEASIVTAQADIDAIEVQQAQGQNYGKNLIINGDFSIWQRGTSQTSSGYGSDDRWTNFHSGSTKTASRQTHTVGVSTNPSPASEHYSRTAVTSVAGASNRVEKIQIIEGVVRTAGKQLTLSFWAKADSAKNMATELVQAFGTGDSPSSPVTSIGVTTHALTTSWQQFTATVTLPSILGKTLGTNSDDSLQLNFWFDAGSDFDARTNSLGQQSGTFDIANVQLEFGDTATEFEYVHPADQLARCQRYFERIVFAIDQEACVGFNLNTTTAVGNIPYTVKKRATPTITADFNDWETRDPSLVSATSITFAQSSTTSTEVALVSSGLTSGGACLLHASADTEVDIDAEL